MRRAVGGSGVAEAPFGGTAEPEPAPILQRVAAGGLAGIPGVLVHGRHDVSGPAETAWRLAQAWPEADLSVVEEEGHGGPLEVRAVVYAVARWVEGWRSCGRTETLGRRPGKGCPENLPPLVPHGRCVPRRPEAWRLPSRAPQHDGAGAVTASLPRAASRRRGAGGRRQSGTNCGAMREIPDRRAWRATLSEGRRSSSSRAWGRIDDPRSERQRPEGGEVQGICDVRRCARAFHAH